MSQKVKRIALLHHTGCGNLGDDVTIDVVIRAIRRRWPDAEIIAFTMNPADTEKRHGISCYPIRRYTWSAEPVPYEHESHQASPNPSEITSRKKSSSIGHLAESLRQEFAFWKHSYKLIRSFDMVVVSGGGQLTERGGPWSFPYALFVWTRLAKWARVTRVFLNVGAGPLRQGLSRYFVQRALRDAEYVSFRDQESQQLAQEIGFGGKGLVSTDSAYGVEFEAIAPRPERRAPVVGFAPMFFPISDLLKAPENPQELQENILGNMAELAALFVQRSFSIKLFGSDVRADTPAIEALRRLLEERYHIATAEYTPIDSVEGLLAEISTMDYVVTCRFHGVVLSQVLNKPMLAIAHHPKVTNLMNELGMSQYCFDMRSFNPTQLADAFGNLVAESLRIKESLAADLAGRREVLTAQFDTLFSTGGKLAGTK